MGDYIEIHIDQSFYRIHIHTNASVDLTVIIYPGCQLTELGPIQSSPST